MYNSIKMKKIKDEADVGTNNSSKYLKKLAKGIWTNLVFAEKKYLLTKYVEKIK
jgi:hypothetical protein